MSISIEGWRRLLGYGLLLAVQMQIDVRDMLLDEDSFGTMVGHQMELQLPELFQTDHRTVPVLNDQIGLQRVLV